MEDIKVLLPVYFGNTADKAESGPKVMTNDFVLLKKISQRENFISTNTKD